MGVVTTKTGDQGTTLLKNQKLSKGSLRLEAMGSIDEVIANFILTQATTDLDKAYFTTPVTTLINLGSFLAGFAELPPLDEPLNYLESVIYAKRDAFNGFVYPFDHPQNARINVLRTVVRRAERAIIRVHEAEELPPELLKYINRLSDYVFVLMGK
jgi:cob(I)alamin adenosyltransferase